MTAQGLIVALSVSNGTDLGRFGYLKAHLRQVLRDLVIALLRANRRVGYGGDLRKDGYTRELFDLLSAAYARSRLEREPLPAIVHYFALSSWREASPRELLDHLDEVGTAAETRFFDAGGRQLAVFCAPDGFHRVNPDSGKTEPVGKDALETLLGEMRAAGAALGAADALTTMRRAMASETLVRVLASGRLARYSGRMPGIFEEAILHIAAGKLVVPLGAFGGASRAVAIELGLMAEAEAEVVAYPETGPGYEEGRAELVRLADANRARAEQVGAWAEMETLARADDPAAIAAGVLRIAERVSPQ